MSDELLDTCGCCEGVTALTPASVENLPGLSALAYRVGTHASFKTTMQAAIAGQPDLADLTTRDSADPAIGLLDAWATVLDVLTFYQERIANEGFLRTATERRSVLELARAIGYELSPGVAAGTYLAFTLEDAPGAPGTADIPAATRVQSLPGPGELPQTFETAEPIEARARWNGLRPRLTQPQKLVIEGGKLKLVGGGGAKIDAKQVYLAGLQTSLKAGDLLLAAFRSGALTALPLLIRRVVVENELGRTRVDFELAPEPALPAFVAPALAPGVVDPPGVAQPIPLNAATVDIYILQRSWGDAALLAFMEKNRWSADDLVDALNRRATATPPPVEEGVFSFRARVAFFGHNAPLYASLPKTAEQESAVKTIASGMTNLVMSKSNLAIEQISAAAQPGATAQISSGFQAQVSLPDPKDWDAGGGRTIWTDSTGKNYTLIDGYDAYLERSLPELLDSTWAVFESPSTAAPRTPYWVAAVTESSLADYAMSARSTGVKLENAGRTGALVEKPFNVRKSTAHVQSERLTLGDLPLVEPIPQGAFSLMLGTLVLGLRLGQSLILSGEQQDAPGVIRGERVVLSDIRHEGGYTVLFFQSGLQFGYVRSTLTINANVALATHGETKRDVLGSGDASVALQKFALKQAPLTFVSSTDAGGAASTLEVRVNDLLWDEVPTLYGRGPRDRVYSVQVDEGGKATIQFGDGRAGARLPTGTENVAATYRVGIGLAGNVKAGQLSLLMTRPLGVRGVANPLPASGAEDAEALDRARENAPFTVLTLDRIVSLRDFEDFARAFAGIGKAHATWLWAGETRLVHITVAAADGSAIDPTSLLRQNLLLAIDGARDPIQRVQVDSFIPLLFNVAAKVLVKREYLTELVLPAVADALRLAFGFERRAFGQAVTKSEVLAVIQSVAGVEAADLDTLYIVGKPAVLNDVLPARTAQWDESAAMPTVRPAELLLLNRDGVALTEMQL